MAIPKLQDFLYPFLLQLKDKDVSNKEMKDILISHFSLTEEDCLMKTKGGSALQIDDRIGWVRQWLRRALIDGIAFAKYMIDFNVGVSTRKTYEVKRIDTDYFEE